MKIELEDLKVVPRLPDEDKQPIWYHVEFNPKIENYLFVSRESLNEVTCTELIEQLNGLELTEKNVLINELIEEHNMVRIPGISIMLNSETVLFWTYYERFKNISILSHPEYDMLALQVLKNKLLSKDIKLPSTAGIIKETYDSKKGY